MIQGSIIAPILFVLIMGKRTHKKSYPTFLCSCAYWLFAAIEATDLLETIFLLSDSYKHIIYTTEAIICIAMIVATSYAIVTLLSYISPGGDGNNNGKLFQQKFDFLYKVFAGLTAVFFCEVPFVVARCKVLTAGVQHVLPGTFYFWLIKDVVFVGLILVMIFIQKFGHNSLHLPCKPSYDCSIAHFEPEKRDRYIYRYKANYSTVSQTEETEKRSVQGAKALNSIIVQSNVDASQQRTITEQSSQAERMADHNKNELARITVQDGEGDVHCNTGQQSCKTALQPNAGDELISSDSDDSSDVSVIDRRFAISQDAEKVTGSRIDRQHNSSRSSKGHGKAKTSKKEVCTSMTNYNLPVKTEKKVMFKFDMGPGKFLKFKSRSDSPPTMVHDVPR